MEKLKRFRTLNGLVNYYKRHSLETFFMYQGDLYMNDYFDDEQANYVSVDSGMEIKLLTENRYKSKKDMKIEIQDVFCLISHIQYYYSKEETNLDMSEYPYKIFVKFDDKVLI